MRWLALVSVLGGAACGGEGGDTTIDITRDPCAAVPLAPATEPTELQAGGIADAIELWRTHGAPSLGARDGKLRTLEPAVPIHFEEASQVSFGYYDDETGIVYVNTRITDRRALSIVLAHELGHVFGLEHVTDRPSLMNPGNYRTLPTAEDQAALEALWGHCSE